MPPKKAIALVVAAGLLWLCLAFQLGQENLIQRTKNPRWTASVRTTTPAGSIATREKLSIVHKYPVIWHPPNNKVPRRTAMVFSLTCHEAPDCVLDLFENIRACFSGFEITILVSATREVYKALHDKVPDDTTFVTVRRKDVTVWGHLNLFHQHMLNMEFLVDNRIAFDYFWFVASNQLFIKRVDRTYAAKYLVRPKERRYVDDATLHRLYVEKITGDSWNGYPAFYRDTHAIRAFADMRLELHHDKHEGMVVPSNVMKDMYDEYVRTRLFEDSDHKAWFGEEIFLFSFIKSRYVWPEDRPCPNIFGYRHIFDTKRMLGIAPTDLSSDVLDRCLRTDHIVTVKPVNRIYDDPLRTEIRRRIFGSSSSP